MIGVAPPRDPAPTVMTIGGARRIHVVQGTHAVSDDDAVVLATILGSCIATCMHDPGAGIGGMNHFLLARTETSAEDPASARYGVHAMELLINGLLSRGARRDRLEARVFGGACMLNARNTIGARNAAFAEEFLARERITLAGGSVGGERGRRVEFWPVSGRVRQHLLEPRDTRVFVHERVAPEPLRDAGSIEFF